MNILLYHFGYRGDILVVGQNFTRELQARYPKASIDLMVRPRMAEAQDFMGVLGLYRTVLLGEKKDYDARKGKYDLAYMIDENVYPEGNLRTPFTRAAFPYRQHRLVITTTPEDRAVATGIVAALPRPIIATQSDMARKWPKERVEFLRLRLSGLGTLLTLGPEERYPGLDRPLTFRESAALVAHADIFVGIDSGIAHAAALAGVQTVLLPPVFPESWISPTEYANPFILNEAEKHISMRPPQDVFCGHYFCLRPNRAGGIKKSGGDPRRVQCVCGKKWGMIKKECCFQKVSVEDYWNVVTNVLRKRGVI